MAKFLFVVPPFIGHINPTLGIGAELLLRGHSVTWVGIKEINNAFIPIGGSFIVPHEELKGKENIIDEILEKQDNGPTIHGVEIFKFAMEETYIPFCNFLVPGILRIIDEFKPDVIYAQASSRESVLFATQMQEYIKKPMVFHMMDDWPSTISEKGPFKNIWKNIIDKEFRILLSKATVLLSISDYMAQEYKARYGKDFTTFHNPIDVNFWKSHQRKNYTLNSEPALLYAGRIGVGIQDSLEAIAKAIDNANKKLSTPVTFVLQTEFKPDWVDNYKCAKHKPLVAYKELPKVFAEADFLILPYDFSDESIKFIKYSMPTKAPEYMMSGTPIVVYAPAVTAIVKDAEKNKWAKIVTENSTDKLSVAFEELFTNETEREQIAEKAIAIAETKFNSINVRNHFREVISSMVN